MISTLSEFTNSIYSNRLHSLFIRRQGAVVAASLSVNRDSTDVSPELAKVLVRQQGYSLRGTVTLRRAEYLDEYRYSPR